MKLLFLTPLFLLFFLSSASAESVNRVQFKALGHGVWMHTSMKHMKKWGNVTTNGLLVEKANHTLLVDTAWNDKQTLEIINWAKNVLKKPVRYAVFTHAHADKMGGVNMLKSQGIVSYASKESNVIAPQKGLTPAAYDLNFKKQVSHQLTPLVIFDPGPGHTSDNIVVGLPDKGIVFGGCLIRPPGATSLGNTADANLSYWGTAVFNVSEQFPDAQLVVPSHGPPAGRELFVLTQLLVDSL